MSSGSRAGITGAIAYSLFEVSLLGGFAYFASTNFNDWFGWEIPWIAFALFAAVLISVLCYFHVELSVKILGAALVSEVIILAIFDLVVFGSGGSDADGIQFESLNMFKLTRPGRRPRRRRRPVPGVLVVGRLRGDPELRGGVQEPEEDHPAGDADLGRRARHRLRHHVAGVRLRVPGERAGQGRAATPNNPPFFLAMEQYGNVFLKDVHAGADPHRLVRLRDGVPQRGHALLLRDGARGHPAARARQDAPQVQVARTSRASRRP